MTKKVYTLSWQTLHVKLTDFTRLVDRLYTFSLIEEKKEI